MFQLIEAIYTNEFKTINSSIGYYLYYLPYYLLIYNNGTVINRTLAIEKCEFGKNITIKYKELEDTKYTYRRKI